MIRFTIRKNDEHYNTAYNIADSNDGYFIRAIIYDEYVSLTNSINIAEYLNIDCCDFDKALSSYGGLNQTYSYLSKVYTIGILYFINREDAELFLKEYLEPQLIAKQLSN